MTTVGRVAAATLAEAVDAAAVGHPRRALRIGAAFEAQQCDWILFFGHKKNMDDGKHSRVQDSLVWFSVVCV